MENQIKVNEITVTIGKNNQVTIENLEISWKLNIVEFYFKLRYADLFEYEENVEILDFILDYAKNAPTKKYKRYGVKYLEQMDLAFIVCCFGGFDPSRTGYYPLRKVYLKDMIECHDGTLSTYLCWKKDARIKSKIQAKTKQQPKKITESTETTEVKETPKKTIEPNFNDVTYNRNPNDLKHNQGGYEYPYYVDVKNVVKKTMAADCNTYIVDKEGHIFNVHPPLKYAYNSSTKKSEPIELSYPVRWQIPKWDFNLVPDEIKNFFDPKKSDDDFFDLD